MATIQDLIPLIYHEKQEPGTMLCAQHALNNLLQNHYYSAPDLSEIARGLDEDENRELDNNQQRMTSMNMDDTGFFSVQVLQKALQNFGLELIPWEAEGLRQYHKHPKTQMAFILNHEMHWYTLRRFGNVSPDPAPSADPGNGHWFNLNSYERAPQRIGELYLGEFLQQARLEGYSVFAVMQKDPSAPLALPRTDVDEHFSYISEDAAGSFSNSYASASSSRAPVAGIEGLEDEDMELQAALQASLAAGNYGDYLPQRFVPSDVPQQSSRTAASVPVRHEPEIIDVDAEEDVEMDAQGQPEDPVAASMARQRATMERMQRAQEFAMREQYQDEVARFEAAARLQQARGIRREEDEDDILRRAIAESEATKQAPGSGQTSRGEEAVPGSTAAPAWQQHRVYDDEDEELQAALRASLETVPAGFRVASPPPVTAPQPTRPHQQSPPQASLVPPAIQRQPSSEFETESEADNEAPQPEQLSVEEIRKRRLARFGG